MGVTTADMEEALRNLPLRTGLPRVAMCSYITENSVESNALDRNDYMEIMLKPVRFAGARRKLVTASKSETPLSTKFSSIIEMGSSTTSQGPIKQVFGQIDGRLVQKVPYALSWQLVRILGKRRLRWQVFSGLPAIHSIWTK